MRIALVLCAFVTLIACAAANPNTVAQFLQFVAKYNKTYTTDKEVSIRYSNFVNNLQRIEDFRAAHLAATGESGDEVYGITKFADLSREEFKQQYLGYTPSANKRSAPVLNAPQAIPSKFDWRTKGVVSPVKNQEQCGSCWAFSATEEIESAWALAGNTLTELSVQQIVSCDTVDQGCNGGDTVTAYQYVEQQGGLQLDSAYPYTSGGGDSGTCSVDTTSLVVTVTNYSYATPPCTDSCDNQNENLLLANLVASGPVSICVYAEPWQVYTGGILSTGCPHDYSDLDHCVQLVAYDQSGTTPYYIIRNSWGTDWGYDGYIYVEIGANVCGVADEATLVTTAAATPSF